MADQTRTRVFISYSRVNADFVDRLEVSLKSNGFDTWVDRRKLEGGQDWPDELQRAIEDSQALALVISPEAIASRNVKDEYRHALRQHLVVIPLLYKPVERVPMDLNNIEWVDFQQQNAYDASIARLVNTLARLARPVTTSPPTPPAATQPTPPTPRPQPAVFAPEPALAAPQPSAPATLSLKELYDQGDAARRGGDDERAAIFFRQILAVNPNYLNGLVAKDLSASQAGILRRRIDSLRVDARQAHGVGDWGREISNWQALLTLDKQDSAATDQLANARQNQNYVDVYAIVSDRVKRNELDLARQMLKNLWEQAPFYGDPEGLARKLSMVVPPSYEAARVTAATIAKKDETAQARRDYLDKRLLKTFPFTVWLSVVLFLSALGCVGGWITSALTGASLSGPIGSLLIPAIVAALVIGAGAVAGYQLGYGQAISSYSTTFAALVAFVLAGGALVATPTVIAWPSHVTTYHFLFFGQLHMATTTPWAFGALFGATFAAVGVSTGWLIGGIITSILDEDFGEGFGGGLLVGLLMFIPGFIIGVSVGYGGWLIGGVISSLIVSIFAIFLIAGILALFENDDGAHVFDTALPGGLVATALFALLIWLFCWFPFGITGFSVIEWSIGAGAGMLTLTGLVMSIVIWAR